VLSLEDTGHDGLAKGALNALPMYLREQEKGEKK